MRYRLTRIEPMSAAKSLAATYAVLGLIGGFFAMYSTPSPDTVSAIAVVVKTVLASAAGGFIGTLLMASAFNASASVFKGIEVRLEPPDAA